jgi:EmrB/QacA subfamily drug resistance transporter
MRGPPATSPNAPKLVSLRDRRWTLAAAILGSSMAFLDATVVNVALPVIQRELRMTVDLAQWVVEAYALLLSSLVLVGGALGDRYGRSRIFTTGVAVFALASAACGLAPDARFLIAARALQGAGAALLVPGSLSLISAANTAKERGAAIGTWSAFSAITGAIGPVAGGWVVAHGSWRWLFFFNVPIAVIVAGMTVLRVDETRDENAADRTDWLGAALATAGLGFIVFGLIDSARVPGRARLAAFLMAGALSLVGFLVVEARARSPMVPLSLFRSRTFAGTNLLTLLLYAALGATMFFLPFDLIQVQGYTPLEAGASLLPFVVLIAAMSPFAGAASARFGARAPLVAGPLVASTGFALLALPGSGGSYVTTFFPGVVVLGVGMGITVAPLTTALMGSVEVRHAGVASGINNAVARAAGLLAIAALGVVLLARFNGALAEELTQMSLPPEIGHLVSAERGKLLGADFSSIDPALAEALRRAFAAAYVAAFRTLMLVNATMAAAGALGAAVLVCRRSTR